jgi:hypothetical protein
MFAVAKVESRQFIGVEFRQANGGGGGLLLLVVRSHAWLGV